MLKRIATLLIAITMISIGSAILVSGQEITVESHDIEIEHLSGGSSDGLIVESMTTYSESLTIKGDIDEYYETITFWIYPSISDVEISIDGKTPNSITVDQSLVECNVSGLNIPMNKSVEVSIEYGYEIGSPEFQKILKHKTTALSVSFNGEVIFTAEDLAADSYLTLDLTNQLPVTEKADYSMYLYAIILLIVIIAILAYLIIRKPKASKPTKTKVSTSDSEELLTAKKALLMESLKDIEKKHRANQISDDTYNKLRDRYKQEAVETMKKLEDIK